MQKPWLMDTRKCWEDYFAQVITGEIFWYYSIELSFYMSLLVSQFTDVKRKDFWQLFVHHIVTIALILLSYMFNFQRVGTLILLLHDSVDYWLELAKMANYAKFEKLCDRLFIVFTIVWCLTRILLFPFK